MVIYSSLQLYKNNSKYHRTSLQSGPKLYYPMTRCTRQVLCKGLKVTKILREEIFKHDFVDY